MPRFTVNSIVVASHLEVALALATAHFLASFARGQYRDMPSRKWYRSIYDDTLSSQDRTPPLNLQGLVIELIVEVLCKQKIDCKQPH